MDIIFPQGKLDKFISFLEDGLKAVRKTPYHRVIGRDFLHQTRTVADYLIEFHKKASSRFKIAAIYCEMNGFTINTGRWFFSAFGYKKAGSIWDLDWLAHWDAEAENDFTLQGMEPVQVAFEKLYHNDDQSLGVMLAEDVTEKLVTARFMQLIAVAHQMAKRRCPALKGLPVLATAHDWEEIHQSQ